MSEPRKRGKLKNQHYAKVSFRWNLSGMLSIWPFKAKIRILIGQQISRAEGLFKADLPGVAFHVNQ